jgi:hypothetical protein
MFRQLEILVHFPKSPIINLTDLSKLCMDTIVFKLFFENCRTSSQQVV